MSSNYINAVYHRIGPLVQESNWIITDTSTSQVRLSFNLSHEVSDEAFLDVEVSDVRIAVNWDLSRLPRNDRKTEIIEALAICFLAKKNIAEKSSLIIELWDENRSSILRGKNVEKALAEGRFCVEIATPPVSLENQDIAADLCLQVISFFDDWLSELYSSLSSVNGSHGDIEGKLSQSLQTIFERSAANRSAAIDHHGLNCNVCGYNFFDNFGELGEGFIHVHHIEKLADTGAKLVDPQKDLITVCPNCHAMLHKKNPPMLPDDLKSVLASRMQDQGN